MRERARKTRLGQRSDMLSTGASRPYRSKTLAWGTPLLVETNLFYQNQPRMFSAQYLPRV